MRYMSAALVAILGFGCRKDPAPSVPPGNVNTGLITSHSPNPCDVHTHTTMPNPAYPYMWFYETSVTNTVDVPLRVVWFQAFYKEQDQWIPGNIYGRDLTAADFSKWYPDDVEVVDGVIPAGATARDARNWHGSEIPSSGPIKWAYRAVDPQGNEYYAEAIVECVPVR